MATPFIAQVIAFCGNYAPRNFAKCDGQLLSIAQNEALYALVGTTYGGDGQVTFGLPDLRGRSPRHDGTGPGLSPRTLGETGGLEQVTLQATQLPNHTHPVLCTTNGPASSSPAGGLPAPDPGGGSAGNSTNGAADLVMRPGMIGVQGGSQPHENRPPYLAVNFVIALFGIFPSRN